MGAHPQATYIFYTGIYPVFTVVLPVVKATTKLEVDKRKRSQDDLRFDDASDYHRMISDSVVRQALMLVVSFLKSVIKITMVVQK